MNDDPKLGGRAARLIRRVRPHLSVTGWATLDAFIGPVISVAVAPILLFRLEPSGFGLWAFAIAIAGFGGLASLGVGIATTKLVAEDRAAGPSHSAVTTTRAALSIALIGGLLLLVSVALVGPSLARHVFVRMGGGPDVVNALLLGVALLALQEVDSVFTGALKGLRRFDIAAGLELGTRLGWVAAVAGTAWVTGDVIATLIASVLVSIIKVVFKGWAAQHALQGPCLLPSLSRAAMMRILRLGKWLWVQGLGGLLFSVVDKMVVGAVFGASDLGRYSICMQLAQLVHGIQANALQPMLPWMASRVASRQLSAATPLKRIAVAGGFACLAVPVLLIAFAETILRLWVGADFARENAAICRLLIGAYGLLAFNIPVHYMLLGLGSVRFLALTNFLAGLTSLSASLLMSQHGLANFVLGKLFFAPLILLNFLALHRSANRTASFAVSP